MQHHCVLGTAMCPKCRTCFICVLQSPKGLCSVTFYVCWRILLSQCPSQNAHPVLRHCSAENMSMLQSFHEYTVYCNGSWQFNLMGLKTALKSTSTITVYFCPPLRLLILRVITTLVHCHIDCSVVTYVKVESVTAERWTRNTILYYITHTHTPV